MASPGLQLSLATILFFTCNQVRGQGLLYDFTRWTYNKSVDVGYLVLRSDQSKASQFYLETKKIVYWLTKVHMNIHPEFARVSIVTFAKSSEILIDSSSRALSKCQLLDIIENDLVFNRDASDGHDLTGGLEKIQGIFNKGVAAKKILFIFTNGYHNDSHHVVLREIHQIADVYVVRLKPEYQQEKAKALATHPNYYATAEEWRNYIYITSQRGLYKEDPSWFPETTCPASCVSNAGCFCDGVTGAKSCLCLPGFTDVNGQCTACPDKTYKSQPGEFSCARCPYTSWSLPNRTKCECPKIDPLRMAELCQGQCDSRDCPRNKTCTYSENNNPECVCKPGRIGSDCDRVANHCHTNICRNSSPCGNTPGGYYCWCAWSHVGAYCERQSDDCGPDACAPDEACSIVNESLKCVLKPIVGVGVIVGAVIGGVVLVCLIIVIIILLVRRKRRRRTTQGQQQFSSVNGISGLPRQTPDPAFMNDMREHSVCTGSSFIAKSDVTQPPKVPMKPPRAYPAAPPSLTPTRPAPPPPTPPKPAKPTPPKKPQKPPRHRPLVNGAAVQRMASRIIRPVSSYKSVSAPQGFAELRRPINEERERIYENLIHQRGMKRWKEYVEALVDQGRVGDIYVCKRDNSKYIASSSDFRLEPAAVTDVYNVIMSRARGVTVYVTPRHKYNVQTNNGTVITGRGTYNSPTGPQQQVMVSQITKDYIILATADDATDSGQCEAEVTFLGEHFAAIDM